MSLAWLPDGQEPDDLGMVLRLMAAAAIIALGVVAVVWIS